VRILGAGEPPVGRVSKPFHRVSAPERSPKPTNDGNEEGPATWSPDGRHILFNSNRSGDDKIWIMNPDGSDPVLLAGTPSIDWTPSWAKKPSSCLGHAVTVEGTNGPDVLRGTPGPDVISGRGGNDRMRASAATTCSAGDGARTLFMAARARTGFQEDEG
jgi:hypothetical protein